MTTPLTTKTSMTTCSGGELVAVCRFCVKRSREGGGQALACPCDENLSKRGHFKRCAVHGGGGAPRAASVSWGVLFVDFWWCFIFLPWAFLFSFFIFFIFFVFICFVFYLVLFVLLVSLFVLDWT